MIAARLVGEVALRYWGYVYDFDEDWGGFAAGECLLRANGELLRRAGTSSSANGQTMWRFGAWESVEGWRSTDVRGCAAWLRSRGYDLFEPSPVAIDQREAGPF